MAGKEPSKGALLVLEGLVRDVRLSCRNLARNPGFTIVVIVTLALGIEPRIGRGFLPEEGQAPGRHAVAMISDRLWRDRFHGSRDIVGRPVTVNGHPFTLVGVMPAHFK